MSAHPLEPIHKLVVQALEIRLLFCADRESRRAFGAPPHTEDIVNELANEEAIRAGAVDLKRVRIRFGKALPLGDDPFAAYTSWTLVTSARPTAYERKYVWSGRSPDEVSGLFLRCIVVRPDKRRCGLGTMLIEETKRRAECFRKKTYGDVRADNVAMRTLAERTGGTPNMFWHTPRGTLMVRYIWI